MTDNELIAEFMGFEVSGKMPISKQSIYSLPYIDTSLGHHYFGPHRSEQMQFRSSWDWLMPVVQKTFDSEFMGNFEEWKRLNNKISQALSVASIESVYKAVVEFIKWYNTSPKQ